MLTSSYRTLDPVTTVWREACLLRSDLWINFKRCMTEKITVISEQSVEDYNSGLVI